MFRQNLKSYPTFLKQGRHTIRGTGTDRGQWSMTTVAGRRWVGARPVGGSRPPKSTGTSVTLHNCKTPQNKTNTPAPTVPPFN